MVDCLVLGTNDYFQRLFGTLTRDDCCCMWVNRVVHKSHKSRNRVVHKSHKSRNHRGANCHWADPRRSLEVHTNYPPSCIGVDRTPGTVGEVLKPPGTAFEMVPGVSRRFAGSFFRTAFRTVRLSSTELKEAWAQWKRSGKPAAEG
eukprot:165967-Chlamydomonas_euryale.AAC.5